MAPSVPATPSGSKPRVPPRSAAPPSATAGRVTRLRAAKEVTASPMPAKPPGLLARGKEGFRKVSDKIKEKEKEKEREKERARPLAIAEGSSHTETLQAFLRIRPAPHDAEPSESRPRPYLEPQNDREVLMRAPVDPSRPHILKPPHIFSFDRVFPPSVPQSTFFTETTLPLVSKLLQGENGLMFAYGVSNSGKTYTISGGKGVGREERGLLPRSVDVLFNSIEGMESKANLRCSGMADVVMLDGQDPHGMRHNGSSHDYEPRSEEVVKVDRNFSYAVFVSYSEVYNEKIFDLLDSVLPGPSQHPPTPGRMPRSEGGLPRSSSHLALSGAFGSYVSLAAMANGGGGVLKRKALVLKNDPEGNGKYIAGLNEVRVRSREEALSVFRCGQRARQVFGTLANRESSRSHGIFTIKVVRIHNGAPNDPDSAQVSRLAIVDLAGSERTRNTGTTGDRLKEAGNINKSLMVLGQCLEVLRLNQQRLAVPTPAGQKKKLAVVPFRHSKLTEIFQNFFVGDGRAVMIVNVNPYDTGYDENAHVMRFSAVAREIQTTASNKLPSSFPGLKRQFSAFKQAVSGPMKIKVVVPVLPKDSAPGTTSSKGTVDAQRAPPTATESQRESQGFVMVEEEIEVVEEDEEGSDEEEDRDALVEYLFEQLKEYKIRLCESEMRNAAVEVEVREEVAREMQEGLLKMHTAFNQRFNDQVAASELKTDRKLDILHRTIATPAISRIATRREETSEDEDISMDALTVDDAEQSFASALDTSDISIGGTKGRVSDPFAMRSPGRGKAKETRASETTLKEAIRGYRADISDSDGDQEEEDDEEEADETLDVSLDPLDIRNARAHTAESEDVLLSAPIEVSDSDSALSEEDELEDDEDDQEEGERESTPDNSEDENFDASAADAEDEDPAHPSEEESEFEDSSSVGSEFVAQAVDDDDDAVEEEEDEVEVRRVSATRRRTGSPVKPSSSASPRKAAAATKPKGSTRKGGAGKAKTIVASESESSPVAPKKMPLRERKGQDTSVNQDEEEEEEEEEEVEEVEKTPVKTPKKKRTLGKKVVMEEEMLDAKSTAGGSVRRLTVRTGKQ